MHSKIVLIMTSVLIVSGTLAFLLLEYNNPGTIGDMSFGEKLMSSLFHSVSTRTAGFATVPQGELTQGTMFTTCILMFIGGSPGGTAGGVKTTTIAMLILCCVSVLQNSNAHAYMHCICPWGTGYGMFWKKNSGGQYQNGNLCCYPCVCIAACRNDTAHNI